MELKLVNRDYVPDGLGGMKRLTGAEEVLGRVLYRLCARQGAFPFLPELGSRLHLVLREKPSVRQDLCARYVAQALEAEPEVRLAGVTLTNQGEQAVLTVYLEWQGERLNAQIPLAAD